MSVPPSDASRRCELCGREDVETTVHHLTPKEKGGTFLPTALLCRPCHSMLHATFPNEELASRLSTIDALRAEERLQPYLRWIRKQPSGTLPKVKKSRALRNR
ncbi:HNH endonuclease [Paenibacillus sp. TRM 82003]|nr:HNH endonuclease [Paenibacillus sp. TRM 82003]